MRDKHSTPPTPELWGGVECTINRVGDRWFDQLADNGHRDHLDDLDRFAELGIRKLRFPVLWERHATADESVWNWPDAALTRLRSLGVEPILGLLHHGSGPPGTSLVDERFADGLVAHAETVARRYPWAEWYTPINEPLTTARFSTLYGLWYPHARDDRQFARALLNQCKATVLAMRAIRRVNPQAKLVQTEDLGRVFGTLRLQYQVDLENDRRWLTWDLLNGRVDRSSPAIRFLLRSGVGQGELAWFVDNPCPPDVIGLNHYVTSDRWLDQRIERYADIMPGGNGRDRYVDTEAVRVLPDWLNGWRRALSEAWNRYRQPLAITEAHLGCSRDEQLRWLCEAWSGAEEALAAGADVRAVTAWALLGSRDWNSLLTRWDGHYEPGAFDVRGSVRRPTAIAGALRDLARGERRVVHPVVEGAGWWRRPLRLTYGSEPVRTRSTPAAQRPVLITGAGGNLGHAIALTCELRGLEYQLCTRKDFDICAPADVQRALREFNPWAVINAAGYVRVDDAEREDARCYRENAVGPLTLAHACADAGVRFVTFSSDLVFDGRTTTPYVETSNVAPLNVYGRSKARAEDEVIGCSPEALVIRTSSFFGPWHPHDFLTVALRTLARRERFAAMDDVVVSPTYVPDLANACLDLLIDGERGIWHLANRGSVSWVDLARMGARIVGIDAATLEARSCAEFGLAATRPAFSVLGTARGFEMPGLENAIARYATEGRHLR